MPRDGRRVYFPTPAECLELGKWWNVPEDEHAALIEAETASHPWEEIIAAKLGDPGLYAGRMDETPTAWDGTLADSTDWGNTVTITRIGIAWLKLTPEQLGRGMNATKTISACMRKLGWTLRRQRIEGMASRPWVWVNPERIRDNVQEIADSARERSNSVGSDDEDIPF